MDKEQIINELKSLDSIKDLQEIREACYSRIVEVVDASDKSVEEKISILSDYATGIYDFLPSGEVWDDIIDYINGDPSRNELIEFRYLVAWIDNAPEYEKWRDLIYEDLKEGTCGFIWDW